MGQALGWGGRRIWRAAVRIGDPGDAMPGVAFDLWAPGSPIRTQPWRSGSDALDAWPPTQLPASGWVRNGGAGAPALPITDSHTEAQAGAAVPPFRTTVPQDPTPP